MNAFEKQADQLNNNLQKLIDLINNQQNEINNWKRKYEQLKKKGVEQSFNALSKEPILGCEVGSTIQKEKISSL